MSGWVKTGLVCDVRLAFVLTDESLRIKSPTRVHGSEMYVTVPVLVSSVSHQETLS